MTYSDSCPVSACPVEKYSVDSLRQAHESQRRAKHQRNYSQGKEPEHLKRNRKCQISQKQIMENET